KQPRCRQREPASQSSSWSTTWFCSLLSARRQPTRRPRPPVPLRIAAPPLRSLASRTARQAPLPRRLAPAPSGPPPARRPAWLNALAASVAPGLAARRRCLLSNPIRAPPPAASFPPGSTARMERETSPAAAPLPHRAPLAAQLATTDSPV